MVKYFFFPKCQFAEIEAFYCNVGAFTHISDVPSSSVWGAELDSDVICKCPRGIAVLSAARSLQMQGSEARECLRCGQMTFPRWQWGSALQAERAEWPLGEIQTDSTRFVLCWTPRTFLFCFWCLAQDTAREQLGISPEVSVPLFQRHFLQDHHALLTVQRSVIPTS